MSNFSILISNDLSSFFFFCARRINHRGSTLGGIALDPLRGGGGITARGDVVCCPLILVSFSILIPNTALSPQIVFAAGRRCAGRCERALLLIVLDAGRRHAARRSWGALLTIVFAAGRHRTGRSRRALPTIVFDAGRRRAGQRGGRSCHDRLCCGTPRKLNKREIFLGMSFASIVDI